MEGPSIPKAADSITNRLANSSVSLYPICVALRERLYRIPAFAPYLTTASTKPPALIGTPVSATFSLPSPSASTAFNPVDQIWNCFRCGTPLCYIFNTLASNSTSASSSLISAADSSQPPLKIEPIPPFPPVDSSDPQKQFKQAKVATMAFLSAMKKLGADLRARGSGNVQGQESPGWDEQKLFTIRELMGNETHGLVKVIKTVSLLLDQLEAANLLSSTTPPPTATSAHAPQTFLSGPNGLKSSRSNPKLSLPPGASGNSGHMTSPLSPSNHSSDQRDLAAEEILTTERKYVMDLDSLQEYHTTLIQSHILSNDIAHQLFSNLSSLVDFQRRFLIAIEGIAEIERSENINSDWGGLFINHEEDFKVYMTYCANITRAQELMVQERATLDQCKMLKHSELGEFIIKPLQRICKYPLLLERLVKHTPTEDPSYARLTEGHACASRILKAMNAAMHQREKAAKVVQLVAQVEDWKGHDVAGFGNLLMNDYFVVSKNDVDREYFVYLFEKILLCCKELPPVVDPKKKVTKSNSILKKQPQKEESSKSSSRTDSVLQLKGRIFMANVTGAYPSGNDACGLQVWWRGDADQEYFTIKCRSTDQLLEWQNVIKTQMEEVNNARRQTESGRSRKATNESTSYGDPYAMFTPADGPSQSSSSMFSPLPIESPAFPWNINRQDDEGYDVTSGFAAPSRQGTFSISSAMTASTAASVPGRRTPSLPVTARSFEEEGLRSRMQTVEEQQGFAQQWRNPAETENVPPLPGRALSATYNRNPSRSVGAARPTTGPPPTHNAMSRTGSLESSNSSRFRSSSSPQTSQIPTNRMNGALSSSPTNNWPIQEESEPRSSNGLLVQSKFHDSDPSAPKRGSHVSQLSQLSISSTDPSTAPSSSAGLPSSSMLTTPTSSRSSNPPIKVKVRYRDDLFVIAVDPDIDYATLLSKVERKVRLCGGKRDESIPLKLRWLDEDGDLVDVINSDDVTLALDFGRNQKDSCVEILVIA